MRFSRNATFLLTIGSFLPVGRVLLTVVFGSFLLIIGGLFTYNWNFSPIT